MFFFTLLQIADLPWRKLLQLLTLVGTCLNQSRYKLILPWRNQMVDMSAASQCLMCFNIGDNAVNTQNEKFLFIAGKNASWMVVTMWKNSAF